MGGFDEQFKIELEKNGFSMFAVGVVVMILRYWARIKQDGFRGLRIDDYLMLLVLAWYTLLVFMLFEIVQGGGSNLAYPDEYATFTPTEVEERIYGSKLVIVSEQAMLNVIYTIKICLLILYGRLTQGTKYYTFVKCLGVYVACGYVATEIGFFTFCRPFKGYWGMPPPNPQCTTLQHYAINQAVWNLSSDVMMLFIPIPLVIKLKTPLKQKLVLSLVFTLGIYVIIAAILTKVFNLSDVYDTSYMLWYLREASVAVYVANLPILWPLLRDWFPFLRAKTPTGGPTPYASLDSRRNRHSTWRNSFRPRHDRGPNTMDGVVMETTDLSEKGLAGEVLAMHPISPKSERTSPVSSADFEKRSLQSIRTPEPVASPSRSGFGDADGAPMRWEINVETGFDVRTSTWLHDDRGPHVGRQDNHFGGYHAY